MVYLLTAIGLTPGGSSSVHIYTQTVHRTTQKFWKSSWVWLNVIRKSWLI